MKVSFFSISVFHSKILVQFFSYDVKLLLYSEAKIFEIYKISDPKSWTASAENGQSILRKYSIRSNIINLRISKIRFLVNVPKNFQAKTLLQVKFEFSNVYCCLCSCKNGFHQMQ